MKQIEITLPSFHGFYESIWLNEDLAAFANEELNERGITLTDDWELDYQSFMNEIGESYTNGYNDLLNEIIKGVKLEFKSVWSPKYYNYTTDKINAVLTIENTRLFKSQILSLIDGCKDKLAKVIKKNHTSCSGFISFMSNDLNDWKRDFMTDDSILSYLLCYLIELNVDLFDDSIDYTLLELCEVESTFYTHYDPQTQEAKNELERIELKEAQREWDRKYFPELALQFA